MTLLITEAIHHRMVGYLVNNVLAEMWKGAIVAHFEVLFRRLPRWDEESHEIPQSGSVRI
jgi:hypothetical protein